MRSDFLKRLGAFILKECAMKTIFQLSVLACLILILTGFPSNSEADEKDNACYIKASQDVRIEVHNLDLEGNKGYLIWKGVIKEGKQKLIQTSEGRLRYSYTTYVHKNEPLEGDIDHPCNNGRTFGVP